MSLVITFRGDGAWGTGLGRNLQAHEIDGNFYSLAQAIVGLQTNPAKPDGIANITVAGTQMSIVLTSGATLGPFTLPVLKFRWRGEWEPGTPYAGLDTFTVEQVGIFTVMESHTSAATFDAAALGTTGSLLYNQLFGAVDASLSGLRDVQITDLADQQFLRWNAGDELWENVSLGGMAYQQPAAVAISGGSISGASVTGLPAPVLASDAVTKAYADALALGPAAIADGTVLANVTGGPNSPTGTTLSALWDHVFTTARGSILHRTGAGWVALAPGTSGQVLKSNGTGADVSWGAQAAGVTSISAGTGISTGGSAITTTGTISLAAIATGSLLANISGGSAAPSDTTVSALLDATLSTTRGTVIYRGAAGWTALLPGLGGKYLKTQGSGADPMWDSPAGAGTVTAISAGSGISTGGGDITSTGTVSLAAVADSNLLANISGGSAAPGATTLTLLLDHALGSTQGNVLHRNATGWVVLAPGTNGQVLTSGGAAANVSWANAPSGSAIADKRILANLSGGSATATGQSLSDIFDSILASTQGSVIYRSASGWSALAAGTAGQVLTTGGASANPSWSSAAASGSLAGLSDVAETSQSDKELLSFVASSGKWANKSLASVMEGLSSTRGSVLYRGATGWVALGPGTSGQLLQSGGAGADPSWVTGGGGGSSTLAGDTDVVITSAADKDVLVYDSATSKWKNQRAKYTIGSYVPGVLTATQSLLFHRASKAFTIPANFGSYLGHVSEAGGSANATGSTVITVSKAASATPNSFSTVGTITIAAGGVVPTFATTGGVAQSFAQGDVLRMQGPGSADATFADFYCTIIGSET